MKHSDTYSISLMCKCLKVSRASFYHYFYYSPKDNKKEVLLTRILTIFFNSKKTYDSPRITAVLNKEGTIISIKTVRKYMRMLGIKSISKEKYPSKKIKCLIKKKKKSSTL